MIIELLMMKLTLDAILQHCNNLAYEQEAREDARRLKANLLKLMTDYETGVIDGATYSQEEAKIMSALSKLTQRITSNQANSQPSVNLGLGLGL
jgi:hypothetical protein